MSEILADLLFKKDYQFAGRLYYMILSPRRFDFRWTHCELEMGKELDDVGIESGYLVVPHRDYYKIKNPVDCLPDIFLE